MKKLITLAMLVPLVGASAHDKIVESRTLQETLSPADPSATVVVVVDNIFGSIRVVGHDRPVVEMVATETVRAKSSSALERARDEVTLDVRAVGNEITFFVDGPFRENRRHDSWPGYIVVYDFEINVPVDTDLELRTVNEGEIHVSGVHGHFHVANVNGGVEMNGVGGSGEATTVNGPVRVRFDENPREDSSFETINGTLDFSFQPDLSADLHFKTFNGEIWSDFQVEPLPLKPTQERSEERGRVVIRTDAWTGVRVASGGPRLSFETLNGDILIRGTGR